MPRPLSQTVSPARWLLLAILVAMILSLTPTRHTGWVS